MKDDREPHMLRDAARCATPQHEVMESREFVHKSFRALGMRASHTNLTPRRRASHTNLTLRRRASHTNLTLRKRASHTNLTLRKRVSHTNLTLRRRVSAVSKGVRQVDGKQR